MNSRREWYRRLALLDARAPMPGRGDALDFAGLPKQADHVFAVPEVAAKIHLQPAIIGSQFKGAMSPGSGPPRWAVSVSICTASECVRPREPPSSVGDGLKV